MSTLTALLLILFGLVLAVSILLWAAVRPRPHVLDAPELGEEQRAPAARPEPANERPTPAVRLRPNRLAPPPADESPDRESDAFERFLQPKD